MLVEKQFAEGKETIMLVRLVDVEIKPDNIDEFIEATRLNHEASAQESRASCALMFVNWEYRRYRRPV
jgi:hypothetical protein